MPDHKFSVGGGDEATAITQYSQLPMHGFEFDVRRQVRPVQPGRSKPI